MVWRYLPAQGLWARLLLLTVAPTLLCVLAMSLGVGWLSVDQQRAREARALDLAAARIEWRLGQLRDHLAGLARLLSLDERAMAVPDADGAVGAAPLERALELLRRAEPLAGSLELETGEPPRRVRASVPCAGAAPDRCAVGLPSVRARVPVVLPGGGTARIGLAAPFDRDLTAWLAAGEGMKLALVVDGEARPGTANGPVPAGRVTGWAPSWLLSALAEGRVGSGALSAGERSWAARAVPLDPALVDVEPGALSRTPPALLLMVPADAGGGVPHGILALVLGGLVLLLALMVVAGGARRLAGAMVTLGDALRSLGRGESAVAIPATPPGAPREVAELMEACILLRDGVAERSRMSERLRWLANFDGLTGLPNRALLGDRLELAFAAAKRDGSGLAVLALDLDFFKEVNDTLGHAAGDEVLRVVAARLRGCLRATDTLARTGGDEFVLVAPELDRPELLAAFAQRLLAAMEEPVPVAGDHRTLGLSIGAAIMEAGRFDDRPQTLLQDADLALYQAKAEGRSCLRIFEPAMDERLRTRRALVADLRNAVADRELVILFQPQVAAATGRITGAEALLRWHHPTRGLIAPDVFIPLAEETGLIVPIGAWVLEEACHVARGWGDLRLAVNVSAIQVRQASFVATVEGALARSGLPPERLELEITEAAMLANSAETMGILSRLRSLGVRLAMDDFGTGYSSLATLQRFRFDKIKVDRSFIRHLAHDTKAVALLRAVIALGSALDVRINAEGVEDEEQLQLLRAEGCDEAQGFLFGRPMSAAAFRAQVGQERSRAA